MKIIIAGAGNVVELDSMERPSGQSNSAGKQTAEKIR